MYANNSSMFDDELKKVCSLINFNLELNSRVNNLNQNDQQIEILQRGVNELVKRKDIQGLVNFLNEQMAIADVNDNIQRLTPFLNKYRDVFQETLRNQEQQSLAIKFFKKN